MKNRNKVATIVLFLAALIVGFDAQPSWSQFGSLDPGYSQCQINFGAMTNFVLVGMVRLPDGSLLVGAENGDLWSIPPLPSDGTQCPTSSPTLLSNQKYAGMALGLDGKVYANKADFPTDTDLVTINPLTGTEDTPSVLTNINGLALALDPLTGDLYVTRGGTKSDIRVITGLYGPNKNPQIKSFVKDTQEDLDGLAWSCDGSMLLAAGIKDNIIIQVDRLGGFKTLVTLPPQTGPDGIAFGARGGPFDGFFFVNSNNGTVTKIGKKGTFQKIIASNGQRGDFVAVDAQGNLLLTQLGPGDHITRLSTTSGGQWVLPGSGLCSDLGCGAQAVATRQVGQEEACLSGLDANLVLTLSQSACGTCESCSILNQARSTLNALLNALDPPSRCLDSLKVTLQTLSNTCPCGNPLPFGCPVAECVTCMPPPTITKSPLGIDLESYDPVLETFMRKVMSP